MHVTAIMLPMPIVSKPLCVTINLSTFPNCIIVVYIITRKTASLISLQYAHTEVITTPKKLRTGGPHIGKLTGTVCCV